MYQRVFGLPFCEAGNAGSVAGRLSLTCGLSCCTAETTRLCAPETTEELDCSERRRHETPDLGKQDELAQPTAICRLRFCV